MMSEEEVPRSIQRQILKVLRKNQVPLSIEIIAALVDSSYQKKYKIIVPNLVKSVGAALLLYLREGYVNIDRNGHYYLGSKWLEIARAKHKNIQTARHAGGEQFSNVLEGEGNACSKRKNESCPHNLDPNKRQVCLSEDSLSGNEMQRACKILHTTKRIKHQMVHPDNGSENLEDPSLFSNKLNTLDDQHLCFLPQEGLREFETLSVVHPETKGYCGRLVYLPTKEPHLIPPNVRGHGEKGCDKPASVHSFTNLAKPKSDEFKPPQFVNSHEEFGTIQNMEKNNDYNEHMEQ